MLCKPFDNYIADCANQIKQQRASQQYAIGIDRLIDVNSPFEYRPASTTHTGKIRYGALLIHGLLDSPFSLRDVAEQLKEAGILTRAVLLPGHGTVPTDLMGVKYEDWINTVRYGVDTLREEVDHIFLIGYSTGATLSIYQALHDNDIKGIVLLAPALRIRAPISTVIKVPKLASFFAQEDKWLSQEEEIDYTKYESVPFHPVLELGKLMRVIEQSKRAIPCPVMLTMSFDDETVCAKAALQYFLARTNSKSRSIIYATNPKISSDQRIEIRNPSYPEWHIKQISHIAMPFSPNNPHYGQQGDYPDHSNPHAKHVIYGAYNRIAMKFFDRLYKAKLLRKRRSTLTYNPDFAYMAKSIVDFIKS